MHGCVHFLSCLYFRGHLCQLLFEESADESSNFVSIQEVELSLGVGVVINDSVSITVKRATTLTRVNLNALKDRRHIQDLL